VGWCFDRIKLFGGRALAVAPWSAKYRPNQTSFVLLDFGSKCDCSALWFWAAREIYLGFLLPIETLVFEIQDWGGVIIGLDDNLADVFQTGSDRLPVSLIGKLRLIPLVECGCGCGYSAMHD
jgi:hypothetical protein